MEADIRKLGPHYSTNTGPCFSEGLVKDLLRSASTAFRKYQIWIKPVEEPID